jgi:hypothetical protein
MADASGRRVDRPWGRREPLLRGSGAATASSTGAPCYATCANARMRRAQDAMCDVAPAGGIPTAAPIVSSHTPRNTQLCFVIHIYIVLFVHSVNCVLR